MEFKKYILTIVLTFSTILSMYAQIVTVSKNQYTYIINLADNTATITKVDKLIAGSINIPDTLEYENQTYIITAIGDGAFKDCSYFSEISLPESITSIGTNAFLDCSSMTSIVLPNNLKTIKAKAFKNCTQLTDIELPISLTYIGEHAFDGCESIEQLTIPNGVTTIEKGLLYGCKKLTTLNISQNTVNIGSTAFFQCKITSLNLPSTLKTIGDSAFQSCTKITSLTIGENVTSIGKSAFFGCSSLKTLYVESGNATLGDLPFYAIFQEQADNILIYVPDNRLDYYMAQPDWKPYAKQIKGLSESGKVFLFYNLYYVATDATAKTAKLVGYKAASGNYTIPQKVKDNNNIEYTVTSIGTHAFNGDEGLTSITMPNTITSIANYAFANCSNLTSITLSTNLEMVGANVFENCTSLETLTIPNSTHYLGENLAMGCTSLSSATINSNLTLLPSSTFSGCKNLANIQLPSTITELGDNAFFDCIALKSITLPNNLTTIGSNTFKNCSAIKTIKLPATITSMGNQTFNGCSKLDTINIESQSINIGTEVFENLPENFVILVPTARYRAYKSAQNWSTYAQHIKSLGEDDTAISIDGLYYEITDYTNFTVKLIGIEITNNEIIIPETIKINDQEYTVTFIDANALEGSSNITRIVVPESIITINSNAFDGIDDETKIYVYEDKYETYIADPAWSNYIDKMIVIATVNEFTIDGITYSVIGAQKKEVTIKSCNNSFTDIELNSIIKYQEKSYQLIAISDSAFFNCSKLTSITFTPTITSIGEKAFAQCTGLISISIPETITEIADNAFNGCTSLTDIKLHNKVSKIGNYTFANCTKLTQLTLPESVEELGEGAFSGCTKLQKINIPNAITSIADYTFYNCNSLDSAKITDYITTIGKSAFANCKRLIAIDLSKNIKSIGESAFYGCISLKLVALYSENATLGKNGFSNIAQQYAIYVPESKLEEYKSAENWSTYKNYIKPLKADGKSFIYDGLFYRITDFDNFKVQVFSYEAVGNKLTIPDTAIYNNQTYEVTSIAHNSFEDCSIITEVTLPQTITYIEQSAFANCTRLTTINIPNKITEIQPATFSGCKSLKTITIPENLVAIGEYAFANCDNLRTMPIPEKLTKISKGTFEGCHHLQSIIIPNNIDTIEAFAFADNSANASIILPKSIKYIGESAFSNNKGLEEVEIPAEISYIADNAFNSCWILKNVIIRGDSTKIGKQVFDDCEIVSIYVPAQKLNQYKTTENWSNYKDVIKPLYLATITTTYGCYTTLKNNMLLSDSLTFTTEKDFTLQVFVNGKDMTDSLVFNNGEYTLKVENCAEIETVEAIAMMELKNGAFEIANRDQLLWFMEHISRPGNENANARLIKDIVVTSGLLERAAINKLSEVQQWYPNHYNDKYRTINRNSIYKGHFDGNGHTISGIYINDDSIVNAGLFQNVTGTIENLAITDSYIKTKNNAGILCGKCSGNINNCYAQGVVFDAENAGGIVGIQEGNSLKNCIFEGSVSGTNAGTIVGINSAEISSVITYGTVTPTPTSGTICGINNGKINNCRFFSEITQYGAISGKNDTISLTYPTTYLESASEKFSSNYDTTYWQSGKTENIVSMAKLSLPYLKAFEATQKEYDVDVIVGGYTRNYFTGRTLVKDGYICIDYGKNKTDTFLISSPEVTLEIPNMRIAGKATVKGRIYDLEFSYNLQMILDPTPVSNINESNLKIWGYNNKLFIENGENCKLNIYNMAGILIKSQILTSAYTEINLKSGLYLVKIGSKIVKIAL